MRGGGVIRSDQYTHIINVADISSVRKSYGYNRLKGGGSVTPESLNGYLILGLATYESDNDTTISIDKPTNTQWTVFLGRTDKRQYSQNTSISEDNEDYYWTQKFFTADDVGKDVPIYLATTPPPPNLGVGPRFNPANAVSFKREAVC